jgi:hypothetical protein
MVSISEVIDDVASADPVGREEEVGMDVIEAGFILDGQHRNALSEMR